MQYNGKPGNEANVAITGYSIFLFPTWNHYPIDNRGTMNDCQDCWFLKNK